ncbi:MAG TPA: NifB/NifX family molybdenum-iron cluster-binding protein [Desulfuromonadales bacterium]|nr:NifB/NifX family molybdenum-iron cluster-binding protein [Desulfuromonadales bacterium]
MKICFPIFNDKQLDSRIHGRFGTARRFLVVDSESRQIEDRPGPEWFARLRQNTGPIDIDAVVVGNIGAKSLVDLERRGIKVYQACKATVAANLEIMAESGLTELTSEEFVPRGRSAGKAVGTCGRNAGSGQGRGGRCGLGFGRRHGAGDGFRHGSGRGGAWSPN